MSEKEKVRSLITYLYETMNGELARDYAELDSENIELLLKKLEENKQLHSIIKEVREKIKEFCWDYDYETYSNMTSNEVKELAELLDKENIDVKN